MIKKLNYAGIMFGCDPEFFFRKGKEIIGAEIVLPKHGLNDFNGSRVIIDGVQAELNPSPTFCREVMGSFIGSIFMTLQEHMKSHKKLSIDFAQTIKLSDGDFERLSDDSKKFGCMPSKSSYNGGKDGKIRVNPANYKYRSAGGHIHIGHDDNSDVEKVLKDPVRLIKMMDILVGNTCVLLDRDPGNIERRKVYGKAGEFRTPPHGVEYRTLSNFWLRSYQLMSLVMGLVRHAVIIVVNDRDEEFMKLVDMKDVSNAINNNDFNLALRNFKKIEKLLLEITPDEDCYPITEGNIKDFRHFVKKGLSYWFKEDPVEHWVKVRQEGNALGINDFLQTVVREDSLKTD